mmetsp:Transcript_33344/g.42828  ORF Transcript_33344/g.42828 Transcript_33344/m.42828 type:complete len:536 (-) Transcript_33344:175-1782(-)
MLGKPFQVLQHFIFDKISRKHISFCVLRKRNILGVLLFCEIPFLSNFFGNAMIPQGHTAYSWRACPNTPFGHTSFSNGYGYSRVLELGVEGALKAAGGDEVAEKTEVSVFDHPAEALPADQALPDMEGDGFSVMSYNVLLPNSQDGWWIYKNYQKHVPAEHRRWPHRGSLLEQQLISSNADIICVQEASGDSFEEDFAFMKKAGYKHVLHKKYRFRCATFWKASSFELNYEAHKDRVLLVGLRDLAAASQGKHIFVVNCHLSAGPNPDQRLRQVFDGVDQVRKEINKLKIIKMEEAPVIVCGDFNSEGSNGVHQLLTTGLVDPDFREPNYPDIKLTSKAKKSPFRFKDSYAEIYQSNPSIRPSTFYAPCLEEKFIERSTGAMSEDCKCALKKMFEKFSSDKERMNRTEIDEWLVTINGVVGRGSEYRSVMACLEKSDSEELSLKDFISVYQEELDQGKFWGVENDMYACGADFMDQWMVYRALFDYIYFSGAINLLQIRQPLLDSQIQKINDGDCIPNSWHPSDHLPVVSVFKYQ